MDEDESTREKLLKTAWARWFEADYSWEGLLSHYKWGPDRESLQHYWRTDPQTGKVRDDAALIDAGELIVVEGQKTYHIAHLPLHYEDGSPTAKSYNSYMHEDLASLIEARLQVASKEDASAATLYGIITDKKMNLSGERITYLIRANFSEAMINGVDFSEAVFFKTDFGSTTFLRDAKFNRAKFLDNVYFGDSIFIGKATFSGVKFNNYTTFDNSNFSNVAMFDNAEFKGDTTFNEVHFAGSTSFYRADFSGLTNFGNTSFLNAAFFEGATFSGVSSFEKMRFKKSIHFGHAQFYKQTKFQIETWPEEPAGYQPAFFNTTFQDLADFSGSGFQAFAAFDGARLLGGLRLDKAGAGGKATQRGDFETQARNTFNRELGAILDVEDPSSKTGKTGYSKSRKARRKLTNGLRERLLEGLEGGCRTLKQEMIKQGDKNREQLLYKFELMARRTQKSTPWFEKFLSRRYEQFADYGANALRPIWGILWLWLLFVPIYGLFHLDPEAVLLLLHNVQAGEVHACLSLLSGLPARCVETLSVSASRIFPFGPFEFVSKDFALSIDSPGFRLLFRLLATAESFLALTLAFLFGLSVRRRFQIS